jgi:hypothetical protein
VKTSIWISSACLNLHVLWIEYSEEVFDTMNRWG